MKLLIIEDEPALLAGMIEFFQQEEILCETATSYPEALKKIDIYQYDCILLDINLPGGSGMALLQHLRNNNNTDGVIIISARNSLDDKILALELGADDYITKPFHMAELNARFKALLRRKHGQVTNVLQFGQLRIDLLGKTAHVKDQPLSLTRNEYKLLTFLALNKNKVVGRQAIAEHLFGEDADNLSSFDFVYSHIKNLKKKIREVGTDNLIQTVYGLGYKLAL